MNEKLTAEQRVLQELIDYQCEYKEQTQDYAPGNRYWADKFMTIIGKAKQALTAHTEQKDVQYLPEEIALRKIEEYLAYCRITEERGMWVERPTFDSMKVWLQQDGK